jgi:hypothetical protein
MTRRRVIDVAAAVTGVALLIVALMIFDQRTRIGWGGGADLASVGEDVNYFTVAMALIVSQALQGELANNLHVVVFTATAIVLVVMLMRV